MIAISKELNIKLKKQKGYLYPIKIYNYLQLV